MRPESIRWFERFYWLNIALTVASLTWAYLRPDQLAMSHDPAETQAMISFAVAAEGLVTLGLKFALWFFIARRASGLARWIFVLFVVLAIVTAAFNFVRYEQGVIPGIWIWVAALDLLLRFICLACLFHADARAWFRGGKSSEELHHTFS
jgi:hypothetical protein